MVFNCHFDERSEDPEKNLPLQLPLSFRGKRSDKKSPPKKTAPIVHLFFRQLCYAGEIPARMNSFRRVSPPTQKACPLGFEMTALCLLLFPA